MGRGFPHQPNSYDHFSASVRQQPRQQPGTRASFDPHQRVPSNALESVKKALRSET